MSIIAAGFEVARTTTGEQVFADAASGLTAGTSYKVAFVWWSETEGYSNVAVSEAWSTAFKQLKRFDGQDWVPAQLKRHDGQDWVPANLKFWNGSSWESTA